MQFFRVVTQVQLRMSYMPGIWHRLWSTGMPKTKAYVYPVCVCLVYGIGTVVEREREPKKCQRLRGESQSCVAEGRSVGVFSWRRKCWSQWTDPISRHLVGKWTDPFLISAAFFCLNSQITYNFRPHLLFYYSAVPYLASILLVLVISNEVLKI